MSRLFDTFFLQGPRPFLFERLINDAIGLAFVKIIVPPIIKRVECVLRVREDVEGDIFKVLKELMYIVVISFFFFLLINFYCKYLKSDYNKI